MNQHKNNDTENEYDKVKKVRFRIKYTWILENHGLSTLENGGGNKKYIKSEGTANNTIVIESV